MPLTLQQRIDAMVSRNGGGSYRVVKGGGGLPANGRSATKPVNVLGCVHRGAEVRRVGCETCQGAIKVKVFGCDVFCECTLGKKLDGVACCKDGGKVCEKFEAPPPVARPLGQPVPALFVWIYYLAGSDSTPKGEELRYSMRSVRQNYHGEATFLVVGDKPDWYTGPFIPQRRVGEQPRRKYRDMLTVFHRICLDESLPSDFVWMMDDQYFSAPVSWDDLKAPRYQGRFPAVNPTVTGIHAEIKRDTYGALRSSNSPCADFATHLPHVVNRARWLDLWSEYRLDKFTLLWEVLYWSSQAGSARHFEPDFFRVINRPDDSDLESTQIVNNSVQGWSADLHKSLRRKFAVPTDHETFVVSLPGGRKIDIVDGWSTSTQRKIRRKGIANFEPLTMASLIELWSKLPSDFTFFDVGANFGLFSLACSALFPGSKVVGFEPTPATIALARLIAKVNGCPISYEQVALSDKIGSATLHLSDVSESSNSLRAGFRKSIGSIEVKTETLDSYCGRTGICPDVLKIDAETFEPEILRGGRGVIEQRKPPIVAEVNKGQSVEAILKALPSGYSAKRIEGDAEYENWLFVATPVTREELAAVLQPS